MGSEKRAGFPSLSTQPPFRGAVMPVQSSTEDNPSGSLIWVSDGASLTFNGDVTMEEVKNVDILLKNYGTTE